MDYLQWVEWQRWPAWPDFLQAQPPGVRFWWVEDGAPRRYHEVAYQPGDLIVFGRESAGLPRSLYQPDPDHWDRIPMAHPQARSLNLANCVSIVLYEALRQLGFPSMP
jgi:tRNA (cytidine/uridine-2'-O-)-methyltransferase